METQLTKFWNKVLEDIKPKVSQGNFSLLKPTFLLALEDNVATIAAPSQIIIDMLQKRFAPDIKKNLSEQTGKDIILVFVPKSLSAGRKDKDAGPLFTPEAKPVQAVIGHLPRVRADFTFKSFAVSSSNQLAFVSAQTVAANIGQSYNPLFIYGPVGVGKTHLMHAIANDTYQKDPSKKIIYITSEEFTNEVVEAIRDHDTSRMKRRFRSAFILLIDDVQFIEGKEKVQEELFHTFNILIDNGSQIVLTSDRPPQEIKKLEKRLSSRFAGGLTVDIEKPDLELKTAIIKNKAKKYGHDLPTDVAILVAERAEDARSLEGLLLRIITQAANSNEIITLELAEKALGNISTQQRGSNERLHADDIITAVCSYYQVKSTQLRGPKRDASLVRARQVCMYLLKVELELPLVQIGNLLGGRDHTTIMHGVDKIRGLVEKKAMLSGDIQGITKQFRG